MKTKMCREFENWLERLPRQELSPAFRQHLEVCEQCSCMYQQLNPVAEALAAVGAPAKLSEKKLEKLAEIAKRETQQHKKHLLVFKLCILSIFSLPFIVIGSWLIASFGYNLLATNVSLILAKTFLITFIVAAVVISGVMYGSIQLLAGWIWTQKSKENTV